MAPEHCAQGETKSLELLLHSQLKDLDPVISTCSKQAENIIGTSHGNTAMHMSIKQLFLGAAQS
jgi:hypothetical protein